MTRNKHGNEWETIDESINLPTNKYEADQLNRQHIEKSEQELRNAFSVQRNKKDGKAYLMNIIPIPKGMEVAANSLVNVGLPYVNKAGAGLAYDQLAALTKNYGAKVQHNAGKGAAAAFSTLLIGAKPIVGGIRELSDYRLDRKALMAEMSTVIEASKSRTGRTNEIVQNEKQALWEDLKTNGWGIAADSVTLVPTAMYAVKDHKKLVDFKLSGVKNQLVRDNPDDYKTKVIANEEKNSAILQQKQKEFFASHQNPDGTYIDNPHRPGKKYTAALVQKKWEIKERDLHKKLSEVDKIANEHASNKMPGEENVDHKLMVMSAAQLGSGYLQSVNQPDENAPAKTPRAKEMIDHFKQEFVSQLKSEHDGYDQSQDISRIHISALPGMQNQSDSYGGLSVDKFLAEIFKQHEIDCGRPPIGNDFTRDDQPFMKAMRRIAEALADGKVKAEAIFNLVGDNDVVIHHQGMSRRDFATDTQIDKAINSLMPYFGNGEVSNKTEFYSNYEDPKHIQATVKNNLGKNALVDALFPNEILLQEGMKKDAVNKVRARAYNDDQLYYFVAANVLHVSEKTEEAFKKYNLSDQAIEQVTHLAEEIRAGNMKALRHAVDGADKSIIATIRKVGLIEQSDNTPEGQTYWNDRTKKATELPAEMAKNAREHDTRENEEEHTDRKWRDQRPAKKFREDDKEYESPRKRERNTGRHYSQPREDYAGSFAEPAKSAVSRLKNEPSYDDAYRGF